MLFISSSEVSAFKIGEDADDVPENILEYANVAEWFADTEARNADLVYVKIGAQTLSEIRLRGFYAADNNSPTADNLIKNYTNAAAWLADPDRGDFLYASFSGVDHDQDGVDDPFVVTELSAYPDLSDAQLANNGVDPIPDSVNFATTAVGDFARAQGYRATAVGDSALARGGRSTVIGSFSEALGEQSTALGQHAHAYDDNTTAVGRYVHVAGRDSTAVGAGSSVYGALSTALGDSATALGERNTVLGRGAIAAQLNANQYLEDTIADGSPGLLIECVFYDSDHNGAFQSFCNEYMTDAEKSDSRYNLASPEFNALRGEIQNRLRGELDDLSTNRATAVGTNSRALDRGTTAVGYRAQASDDFATAVGTYSVATGIDSTAVGAAAYATDDASTALGGYARAHGSKNLAVGESATAGGIDVVPFNNYINVEGFLKYPEGGFEQPNVLIGDQVYSVAAISGNLLSTLTPVSGETPGAAATYTDLFAFRLAYYNLAADASPPSVSHVQIGSDVYLVSALQTAIDEYSAADLATVTPLVGNANATAIGGDSQANGAGSVALGQAAIANNVNNIAIGLGATTTGDNAIAIGAGATTTGNNAIAIGHNVSAANNQVVIGSSTHAYRLPGLAAASGITSNTQVVTVGSDGQLSHDGGSLDSRVSSLSDRLDTETNNRESADTELRTDLTTETNSRESADTGLRTDLTTETNSRESADTGLRTDLTTETNSRESGDTELRTDLTTETNNRESADTELRTDLATEITNRESGDTGLRTDLATETNSRESADTELRTDLTTETNSRESGDTELRTDLTTETNNRESGDTGLRTDLATETSNRESADTGLRTDLTTETSSRESGDTGLRTDLTTETNNRESGDTGLRTDLATETSSRESGDTELRTDLTTETSSRESGDTGLRTDLATETSNRESGDTGLRTDLTTETNSRESGDTGLRTDLTTETSSRESGDTGLRTDLTTETSSRESGDTGLRTDLTTETSSRESADTALSNRLDAISQGGDGSGSGSTGDQALRTDLTTETSNRESGDAELRTDLTTETSNRQSADTGLRTDLTTETSNRQSADTELRAGLGSAGDAADANGSAHARVTHLDEALAVAESDVLAVTNAVLRSEQAIADSERAIMASQEAIANQNAVDLSDADTEADLYEGSSDQLQGDVVVLETQGDRTIVRLKGDNVRDQFAALVAALTNRAAEDEMLVGADGEPLGTTLTEFRTLLDGASGNLGTNGRLDYLFDSLYGNLHDGIINLNTNSEAPHVNSIVGRYERGILKSAEDHRAGRNPGAGYEEAEALGTNGTVDQDQPETAADRRIVVQDVNEDGSIRLRTIANTLNGVDQQVRQRVERLDLRVGGLSRRLDKGIAMASALTALPNVTPGNGRYALGVGVGNHGGASALAMGFSGRVGENTYYNLGVATSGSSSTTSRAGVSWAW